MSFEIIQNLGVDVFPIFISTTIFVPAAIKQIRDLVTLSINLEMGDEGIAVMNNNTIHVPTGTSARVITKGKKITINDYRERITNKPGASIKIVDSAGEEKLYERLDEEHPSIELPEIGKFIFLN